MTAINILHKFFYTIPAMWFCQICRLFLEPCFHNQAIRSSSEITEDAIAFALGIMPFAWLLPSWPLQDGNAYISD
jgi:hypothetical protein